MDAIARITFLQNLLGPDFFVAYGFNNPNGELAVSLRGVEDL